VSRDARRVLSTTAAVNVDNDGRERIYVVITRSPTPEEDVSGNGIPLHNSAVSMAEADCDRPGESPEAAMQRHERLWQHHFAAMNEAAALVRADADATQGIERTPVMASVPEAFELMSWPIVRRGGQHVGRPTTGVLAIDHATGVAVVCESERSQHGNRNKAVKRLRELQRTTLTADDVERLRSAATGNSSMLGDVVRSLFASGKLGEVAR
jgi:hypothetical protein